MAFFMEKHRWFAVLLIFLLAGCIGTKTPVISPTPSIVIKPLSVKATSPTTPAPQASPTVADSLIPTVNHAVEKKCLQLLPELPKDNNYSGQIVLARPYTLYEIRSGEKYQIPSNHDIPRDLAVSPDRTLYAYGYYDARQLVIASSDHKIKRILALPAHWYLIRWQNEENLLFVFAEPVPDPDPHWGKYPVTLGLLNPFTGEKKLLPPDFPDIDQLNPMLSFEGSGTTVYDPTLSRVVYERGDWNVILWDIPNKKQLAQLPFGGLGVTVPKWLPDGSAYIMMAQDGYFYRVARDGAIIQVSHVSMQAEDYSWSPDNRHLAFWRISPDLKDRTLHLLDTVTGQMSDLCITIGYDPSGGSGPIAPLPVWSPDGKSLVVEANFNPTTRGSDVLLINLENNTAYKIGENSLPVGWIAEP